MNKEKKVIFRLPEYLHKLLKIEAAKTTKTMNLIIVEILRKFFDDKNE